MVDQLSLLGYRPPEPKHPVEEQEEQLERVSSRIARHIEAYCRSHRLFRADELRAYVLAQVPGCAPASPDRILRDLRQRKVIDYRVVSRRESLYEVIG